MKPKLDNAPGLAWKPRKNAWEARWQCRTDLVRKGYPFKSIAIWVGPESDLTEVVQDFIRGRCRVLQDDMLAWGAGGIPVLGGFDGTLRSLIRMYQTDADSPYHKLRYITKRHYDDVMRTLENEHGNTFIDQMKARLILQWHRTWTDGGKVAMGHIKIGMLRTLLTFGSTILEDEACQKVRPLLRDMKFEMGKARTERLSADQARAIIAKAHAKGLHSIALAQAFQFECILRQKDVIGEWVPLSEPGPLSDVVNGNSKWIRGLRWEEIDDNLILRHVTSKRQKEIVVDLKLAPMVMAELSRFGTNRPASGPCVISERQKQPWHSIAFRRSWRSLAELCGVPSEVRNMDTRAGAISEATDAGAELEHVRHAATHSDISMTQRYSRGSADKVANVQRLRVAHRERPRNADD